MNLIITPKQKKELQKIIIDRINTEGNKCSLNDIDVSKITDMSGLFFGKSNFNCDVSEWNVSKVKFYWDAFEDCDIEEKYKPKYK